MVNLTKQEFEILLGHSVTDGQFRTVKMVYNWYPTIDELEGKKQIVKLYRTGGDALMNDMMETAIKIEAIDQDRKRLKMMIDVLDRRISMIRNGDNHLEKIIPDIRKTMSCAPTDRRMVQIQKAIIKKYGIDDGTDAIEMVKAHCIVGAYDGKGTGCIYA